MARVLLIDPSKAEKSYLQTKDVYPHGGLMMIGTVLKDAGHKVKVVHMLSDGVTLQDVPSLVREFRPDIAGLTMVTFQLSYAYKVARAIKAVSSDIKVVVGGPHASAVNTLSEHTDLPFFAVVDTVVRGEGERAMLALAGSKDNRDGLDSLPMIDLSLTDIRHFAGIYPPGPMPSMPLMFSRGCPFHCAFCSKSVFGDRVRFRSPALVVAEIKQMHERYGVKEIFFQDDTFNTNLDYCHRLLDGILSANLHKKMWFRARLRANEKLITPELLSKMAKARFWNIFYGVESGNQQMLDRSIGKQLAISEIKRAFKLTHEAGIKAEASFIIGMPGETNETVQDSFNLYRELKPDWCSFNRAIPFPGTPFEQEARTKGQLLCADYEDYELNKTLVRTDALTSDDLESWAVKADRMMLQDRMKRPGEVLRMANDVIRNPGHIIKKLARAR